MLEQAQKSQNKPTPPQGKKFLQDSLGGEAPSFGKRLQLGTEAIVIYVHNDSWKGRRVVGLEQLCRVPRNCCDSADTISSRMPHLGLAHTGRKEAVVWQHSSVK